MYLPSIVAVMLLYLLLPNIDAQIPSCSSPGVFQNGYRKPMNQKTFQSGDVLHFFCNDGYHLTGSPKIECQKNGLWTSKIPVCKDPCDNKCKNGGMCEKGKKTIDGVNKCRCRPGFTGSYCETVVCMPPPTIKNGKFTLLIGKGSIFYDVYSQVQYTCEPGFRLNGTSRISCTPSGQWSQKSPVCSVIACKNQLSPPHYLLLNGGYQPVKSRYALGEVLSFRCDDGFRLRGDATSKCTATGFWSTNLWPQCFAIRCPPIVGIKFGYTVVERGSLKLGAKVRYNCAHGYYLYGQGEQSCRIDSNGKAVWNGRQPMCISRALFEQYCAVLGKVMVLTPVPGCKPKANVKTTVVHTTSMDTMTIVTGTAGGILGFLLVVIAIVACQRRRFVRRMRLAATRRPRSWSSEDDRMAFICYSNDVRFFLPSYDEAMRSRPPEPPPFEAVAGNTANQETTNESASTVNNAEQSPRQDEMESGENPYETIDSLPVTSRQNSNPSEPIYAAVQRVLSPFTRNVLHRLRSSSGGRNTEGDSGSTVIPVPADSDETAVDVVSNTNTNTDPNVGTETTAEAEQPQGAQGTSTATVDLEPCASNTKNGDSKTKDKKNKSKGGKNWLLSVTKAADEAVEKVNSLDDKEVTYSNTDNSTDNLTDDENQPLIN